MQWMRMKDSMKRVCPEGILTRVLQLSAVQRRTYSCKSSLVPLAYRWEPQNNQVHFSDLKCNVAFVMVWWKMKHDH